MESNTRNPERDERTMAFLRDIGEAEHPVPLDLQMRLEAHIREQAVHRRTLGWKATTAIILAAAFVLSGMGDQSLGPAYVALLSVCAIAYGVVVRQMIAQEP